MTRLGSQKGAVLSVQSRVSYGSVGNRAAEFALQRLGWDVWPVDTVLYSNHPGHGRYRGRTRPADAISEVMNGLFDLGLASQCDAVLSGYLGHADVGQVLLDRTQAIKDANANAVYCCDPVMGDRQPGVYVEQALVEFFRRDAVRCCDILCPNHFELGLLAEEPLPTLSAVRNAAEKLCYASPRVVAVTSVETNETDTGRLFTLAVTRDCAWVVDTPKLALGAKGAGDLFTALFLSQTLDGRDVAHALAGAVSSTYAVVHRTVERGARELALVVEQHALARPSRWFTADRL